MSTRQHWVVGLVFLCLVMVPTCIAAAPGAVDAGSGSSSDVYRLRVAVMQDLRQTVAELSRRGFDLTFVSQKYGVVELIGGRHEIALLSAMGFTPEIVEQAPAAPAQDRALQDYLDPAEIEARLAQYEQDHPAIARRVAYATDHEGRTAWAMKISDNVAQDEDEPALLFAAQHHAREVMTAEVAMDIIDQLLTDYGVDPEITRWVDSYEIWVMPTHNPDGAAYVFSSNSMWRKNRRRQRRRQLRGGPEPELSLRLELLRRLLRDPQRGRLSRSIGRLGADHGGPDGHCSPAPAGLLRHLPHLRAVRAAPLRVR